MDHDSPPPEAVQQPQESQSNIRPNQGSSAFADAPPTAVSNHVSLNVTVYPTTTASSGASSGAGSIATGTTNASQSTTGLKRRNPPTSSTSSNSNSTASHHNNNTTTTNNNKKDKKKKKKKKHHHNTPSDNHNTTTNTTKKKKKKKKRRWRWIISKPRDLTQQQEQVFMTMKLRKLNRALTGTKTKRTRFEFFALVAYFVLAFGVVSYSSNTVTTDPTGNNNNNDNNSGGKIVLDLTDIIVMMIYILVVGLVTSVFRESKFITLLYWMFIYLPLAAMISSFVVGDQGVDVGGYLGTDPVISILLITAEIAVLVGFLALYKLYPRVVTSAWFRRKSRAGIFWRIKVVSDWTMTYVGSWGRRFTCKYEGETNEQGLPHGLGRWIDDSYSGEVLTGMWIQGTPVAPFASRHYGTGDAFKAVRVGYIMASDDDYTTTKFWPTNEKAPRIGLTSVECSISGSFYNELPLATHLSGPHWLDEDQYSVGMLCSQLTHVDDEEERGHQVVQIKASDPRGIQVRGHVYESTGESFNAGLDKVVVTVDKDEDYDIHGNPVVHDVDGSTTRGQRAMTPRRSLNFMPRASRQTFRPEKIVVFDESDDDDDYSYSGSGDESGEDDSGSSSENNNNNNDNKAPESVNHSNRNASSTENTTGKFRGVRSSAASGTRGVELQSIFEDNSYYADLEDPEESVKPVPKPKKRPVQRQRSFDLELPSGGSTGGGSAIPNIGPMRMTNASLRIQDWTPAPHKDALIFFPGYKVPLKMALEALGQFIAMTRLDSRVYPIIFGWPCGQRFTYHAASRLSASQKNRENLGKLVKGLQAAGVRNVHFMTHSMGVQTLLGAFSDEEDGSRSELSKYFQLDPDFVDAEDLQLQRSGVQPGDGTNGSETANDQGDPLLICRTITMLNPDFALEAFVNRAFVTLRRVCSTVTIIGDRQDKALWASQFMNGLSIYLGYGQPEVLQPRLTRDRVSFSEREVFQGKHLIKQEVVGLSIESLFMRDDVDKEDVNEALLFKDRAPVLVCTEDEEVEDKAWLDVDVIDTTGLDTNIAGIRHSGFNLNPILLKDLEELISTGRRAVNRATLLYRDGNNFSYCHAPSYVAM